jgi:hypothetical protein
MSGIRHFTQIDMRVPATEETHLVRLDEMVRYVAGKIKNPVRALLGSNFDSAYDSTGKTLTQTTAAALAIDGVTLAAGDRILLVGQTDKTQNGIYTVTTLGVDATTEAVLTRAADFDESSDIVSQVKIPVSEGASSGDTTWVLATDTSPIVLDSTNLEFVKDSGGAFAKIVEATTTLVGDDATDVFTYNHNWDTRYVTCEAYDAATYDTVVLDFQRTTVNQVKFTFGEPLETGTDIIVILRAWVEPVI